MSRGVETPAVPKVSRSPANRMLRNRSPDIRSFQTGDQILLQSKATIGSKAHTHVTAPPSWYRSPAPHCGPVREQYRLFTAHPPGWDREIAIQQSPKRFCLLPPGHHPKDSSRSIDRQLCQTHAAPSLIVSCQGHIGAAYVEQCVSRYQRGGMSIRAQPKADQIENRRRSRGLFEVELARRRQKLGSLHGVDLLWRQRYAQ